MFTLCLQKLQRVKYLNRVLRKLIMLIFLGLKLFYQLFLNKILTLVLAWWKKLVWITLNIILEVCRWWRVLHLLGMLFCFGLKDGRVEWVDWASEGIRGRILSNLGRMMQISNPTAENYPNCDLAIRTRSRLCFISFSIFCYFIRFRVLGYKYMLMASKKSCCWLLLIFLNKNYS